MKNIKDHHIFKFIVILGALYFTMTTFQACTSDKKQLDQQEDGKFIETVEPKILWKIVLLNQKGDIVKEWVTKTEPDWTSGDEGLRCSFHEFHTGKKMPAKYTYIEPFYKDSVEKKPASDTLK